MKYDPHVLTLKEVKFYPLMTCYMRMRISAFMALEGPGAGQVWP
jgi:hypothetical protein